MIYRITMFLVFVPFICLGQRGYPLAGPPRRLTKNEERLSLKRSRCLYINKLNAKQRRNFVPFNKSASVKLVSYEQGAGAVVAIGDDTLSIFTPVTANHFFVNYPKIKESKVLTEAGINSLTDIMYNIGFTPVKLHVPISYHNFACYDPRNAIVFMNSEGVVTHYIEFCFECRHYYLSSRKIKNTAYCEQKFDLLKKFFLDNGIQYETAILPKREVN